MLTDEQNAKYEKWNTEAVIHSKEKLQNIKAKALKDAEDKTAQEKKRGKASSTALVACPPLKAKKEKTGCAKAKAIEDAALQNEEEEGHDFLEKETGVMSLFGAKAL